MVIVPSGLVTDSVVGLPTAMVPAVSGRMAALPSVHATIGPTSEPSRQVPGDRHAPAPPVPAVAPLGSQNKSAARACDADAPSPARTAAARTARRFRFVVDLRMPASEK